MRYRLKHILRALGPGFITGASDDDPSGILTYSQTGATFGYKQLWTVVLSIPFMIAIQEMCGRIGMVTGKGLGQVIRQHYNVSILYAAVTLLFVANTINIGADLGAMAESAQLITGLPFLLWLFSITVITLALEIFVDYHVYSNILKFFALSLGAYVITVFVIHQDWFLILRSAVVPDLALNHDYVMNIVAIFGTTISPYLFFWQASEEVEEEVDKNMLYRMGAGIPRFREQDLRNMRLDTSVGMIFSNVVSFFIIVTAASTLFQNHIVTHINTAADAARALEPIIGHSAALIFSLGIIGTGLLAIPVLGGSASYALCETFKLPEGLSKKYYQAHGFYAVIFLATALGAIINLIGIPPFKMLYYTAVFNGISAPPLMVLIMLIARDKKIMGKFVTGPRGLILGWFITGFMTVAGVALIVGSL